MIVLRRRLIFWLLKAYLKRWGRNILYFFGVGLVIFFALNMGFSYFVTKLPFVQKETIGMVGPYTIDSLPNDILKRISRGLTKTSKDGTVDSDIIEKWKIAPNGKSYAFYLKNNLYFSDGTHLTSEDIDYNFSDVTVLRPDKYTIVFTLKEVYSPFLITVSRPIFKKGFVGLGDYVVKKVKLNGNFIESIELYSKKLKKAVIYELFYPTFDSLKTAFALGEISKMEGLTDLNFKNTTLNKFKNSKIEKKVNYTKLVTLFFNTKDKLLSSKTLREGLWYSIPDEFSEGERNSTPLAHFSFVNKGSFNSFRQDLVHAKELIDRSKEDAGKKSGPSLTLSTLRKYKSTAEKIAKIWKELGVNTKIQIVDKVPSTFQVFLGEFNASLDPDQYILWHSDQASNITHYANLRIDKILEDGRKELDMEKRKQIYLDFQKYFAADPPACLLFFPYVYDVSRS